MPLDDDHQTCSVLALDFQSASRLLGSIFRDDGTSQAQEFPKIDGYVVDRRLGRGGGGEVFHARRHGSNQSLALKLLNKTIKDRLANSRAMRELDLLSGLRIPGVPPVEGYGLHNDRMYIVTAHVEGLTLQDHCEQHKLDERARVELLVKAAEAVQRLHERGVLHRDIKPDNIMINREGEPVIIDFGIAALIADDASETLTQDGAPIGSPAFMAPEQARGERDLISTRSDVYSLGATACLLLTGKTPHEVSGPLHEAIRRVAQDPPRSPAAINPSLDGTLADIITRAISPASDERYPSAAALAEDLRRWLRNEPIDWQRPGFIQKQVLAWRRNPKLVLTRAALAAMLLLCIVVSTIAYSNIQTAEERASLAERELQLRDLETQQLAYFKDQTERLREEALGLDEHRNRLLERENKLAALRTKQVDRGRKALELRAYLDGAFILLHIAEDIELGRLDDPEYVREFAAVARGLIESALEEAERKKMQDSSE